jgi:hypothetical protein
LDSSQAPERFGLEFRGKVQHALCADAMMERDLLGRR